MVAQPIVPMTKAEKQRVQYASGDEAMIRRAPPSGGFVCRRNSAGDIQ